MKVTESKSESQMELQREEYLKYGNIRKRRQSFVPILNELISDWDLVLLGRGDMYSQGLRDFLRAKPEGNFEGWGKF